VVQIVTTGLLEANNPATETYGRRGSKEHALTSAIFTLRLLYPARKVSSCAT